MNELYQRYADSRNTNTISAIGQYARRKNMGVENMYLEQKKALYGRYTGLEGKKMAGEIAYEVVKSVDKIVKDRK